METIATNCNVNKLRMKNKTIYICLAIVGTTMAVAMYITMRSGQMLNGDYALYVCQAKSLFTDTQTDVLSDMKTMLDLSTYKYYSPALYPWGLPPAFPEELSLNLDCFGEVYSNPDFVVHKVIKQ